MPPTAPGMGGIAPVVASPLRTLQCGLIHKTGYRTDDYWRSQYDTGKPPSLARRRMWRIQVIMYSCIVVSFCAFCPPGVPSRNTRILALFRSFFCSDPSRAASLSQYRYHTTPCHQHHAAARPSKSAHFMSEIIHQLKQLEECMPDYRILKIDARAERRLWVLSDTRTAHPRLARG